jgi:hypothetical protein
MTAKNAIGTVRFGVFVYHIIPIIPSRNLKFYGDNARAITVAQVGVMHLKMKQKIIVRNQLKGGVIFRERARWSVAAGSRR